MCAQSQSARIESEVSYIRALANIYTCYGFRGERERLKIAMLLTAYFDESGTGHHEQLCVVAGFVGNAAQWASFIPDWISALDRRKNLHMTQLRWSNPRRYDYYVSYLGKLGPIPYKYNLDPVNVRMWHRDHKEIVEGKVSSEFTSPYQLCATTCISTVLSEIAGPDDEVLFIFDRQEGKRAEQMNKLRDWVYRWAKLDKRIRDINFVPRESTVCLDPTDYLAFQLHHHNLDPESKKAKAGMPILAAKHMYGGEYSREYLALTVQNLQSEGMSPALFERLRKAGWDEHGPPRG
jgi:hypothetical protein